MADFIPVPTVELLTRAADAAGRAASAVPAQGPWRVIDFGNDQRCVEAKDGTLVETVYTGAAIATLIAASGPDHWRAVEAMLRALIAAHPAYDDGLCSCGSFGRPCESLAAAVPLAEQVLRDLGGTP